MTTCVFSRIFQINICLINLPKNELTFPPINANDKSITNFEGSNRARNSSVFIFVKEIKLIPYPEYTLNSITVYHQPKEHSIYIPYMEIPLGE